MKPENDIWENIKTLIVILLFMAFPFVAGAVSGTPPHVSWFATHIAIPGELTRGGRETIVIDRPIPSQGQP